MRTGFRPALGTIAAALLLAGVIAGCGGDSEPPRQPSQWKPADALPPNFPADFPVYPNAKTAAVVAREGRAGAVVIWETPDPLPTVQRWFTQEMNSKGWHVTTYPGTGAPWMGDGGVTVVGVGWGSRVSLTLGESDDKTAITVVWHGGK